MTQTVTITLSHDDYLAASRLHFRNELKQTRNIIGLVSVLLALGLLGVFFALDCNCDLSTLALVQSAAEPIAIGTILVMLIIFGIHLALAPQTRRIFFQQKMLSEPWSYRLGDDALEVEGKFGTGSFPYDMVHKLARDDKSVLVYHSERLFYMFPVHSTPSAFIAALVGKIEERRSHPSNGNSKS